MNSNPIFSLYVPTKILFGCGEIKKLATETLPGKKAMVVISGGTSMKKYGYLDKVIGYLTENDVAAIVYDKILPNPIKAHVMEAAAICREQKCDFIIGLGGGSSIDSAKAIGYGLAYDGDTAGVKATERAIMLAGDLGINLSVISNYHGAKDPDELIQKDPALWQQAVAEREPAIEWLLNHYEAELDLTTGDGKREYSNVALRLIGYLHDPVEKKHYEQLVARRLEVSVRDLLAKNLNATPKRKIYKNAKNQAHSDKLVALTNNLLALAVYGGVSVPGLDVPDDDTKLAELELVFEERYARFNAADLATEAAALQKLLKLEKLRAESRDLEAKLAATPDTDEETTRELLRKITSIHKEIAKNS